jgi:hypothetical protein
MTVNYSGKVGIGVTGPGSKLDVDGTIRISTSGRVEGRSYPYTTNLGSGADATTTYLIAGSTAPTVTSIDLAGASAANPRTIIFKTASTERMRITSGGEVKILGDAVISDYKYSSYATAGLDTTGVVVATVTGAGNGASSSIEFVGMGGVNGIVDVVYNCTNQGGNWYAYKNERQTPFGIDVVATGNGTTTLTFTFKAVSSTQGYTPRVRMIGSPSATVFFPN